MVHEALLVNWGFVSLYEPLKELVQLVELGYIFHVTVKNPIFKKNCQQLLYQTNGFTEYLKWSWHGISLMNFWRADLKKARQKHVNFLSRFFFKLSSILTVLGVVITCTAFKDLSAIPSGAFIVVMTLYQAFIFVFCNFSNFELMTLKIYFLFLFIFV